jgi:hypothetical protein
MTFAVSGAAVAAALLAARPAPIAAQADEFDSVVRPVLTGTCGACHNDRVASGGLNVTGLVSPDSLVTDRAAWEKMLLRLRAGDMPPVPTPRPVQLPAMVTYIERAFERADAAARPDPGRMTAHRLNRTEYANTIRTCWAFTSAQKSTFRPTIRATGSTTWRTC